MAIGLRSQRTALVLPVPILEVWAPRGTSMTWWTKSIWNENEATGIMAMNLIGDGCTEIRALP